MYTGDRDVTGDAVGEAFAQALQSGGAIRDPRWWSWGAAFRIAARELERRRRSTELERHIRRDVNLMPACGLYLTEDG
jgi:hypothetical protein